MRKPFLGALPDEDEATSSQAKMRKWRTLPSRPNVMKRRSFSDSAFDSQSKDCWTAWDRAAAKQGRISTLPAVEPQEDQTDSQSRDNDFLSRIHVRWHVKYFDKSVLNYNTEGIVGPGVFPSIFTKASVLCSWRLDRDVLWILAISFGIWMALWHFNVQIREEDAAKLKALVMDLHTLCTFLLGFFLSTAITRWWAMRNDCLGGLWGGVDDLSLIIGSHFGSDSEADCEVRERVLRWSVLSHELIYKQARADMDLEDLVQQGLLLPAELELLKPLASKPQVIWAWMCSYFAHLAYGDPAAGGSRLPFPVTVLPQLHEICRHARGAVGMSFAYTDTQLPFRYVHFLSLIIWTHNIIQAVNSAVVITRDLRKGEPVSVAIEVAFLLVYPLVYIGLLHLGAGMLNPLRAHKALDFPQGAFTYYMLAENQAFYTGNTQPEGPPYGRPPVWKGGGRQGAHL